MATDSGNQAADHADPGRNPQGSVEPPENSGGHNCKEHCADDTHAFDLAEEMHLVIAEELLVKILEPDKAELQPVGRESHPAQGKDDGIKCREDREDQDEGDCRRNEQSPRMAVKPLTPTLSQRVASRGRSRLVNVVSA